MSLTEIPNGVRYTVPDEDRVYTPPAEPEPFVAPQVTARSVTVDGTTLEKALAAMEYAKTSYEKFLGSIPREHFSAKGLEEQIAKFGETDAARAVDKAVAQMEQRVESATAKIAKIRKDLSPAGDAAAESRASRYWTRTKPLLDKTDVGGLPTKVGKLITDATPEQRGVLIEELSAYIEARGHTTDWLDIVIGQAVPEYGAARTQLRKAQQALIVTRSNAESLRKTFKQEGHRSVLVKYDPKLDPDK